MTRNAAQNLSSTTRCLVLALAFAVPLTTGFPPHCAGHSRGDSSAKDCCAPQASGYVRYTAIPEHQACCQHRATCASRSRAFGGSSPCHFSAACQCPPECVCRQNQPTPTSPVGHSTSQLQLRSLVISTAELSLVDGCAFHPSEPLVQNRAGLVTTASFRCALLCRFLA